MKKINVSLLVMTFVLTDTGMMGFSINLLSFSEHCCSACRCSRVREILSKAPWATCTHYEILKAAAAN